MGPARAANRTGGSGAPAVALTAACAEGNGRRQPAPLLTCVKDVYFQFVWQMERRTGRHLFCISLSAGPTCLLRRSGCPSAPAITPLYSVVRWVAAGWGCLQSHAGLCKASAHTTWVLSLRRTGAALRGGGRRGPVGALPLRVCPLPLLYGCAGPLRNVELSATRLLHRAFLFY